jgi:RimJ/RimL family protein N-acetyltransferase
VYSTSAQAKDGRDLFIREAEVRDASSILDYLEVISAETSFLTFGPGQFGLSQTQEAEYLEQCRKAENCLYLLAFLDGELAGTLTFSGGKRPRIRHTGELSMSVLGSYWGLGIASALLDALLEWARATRIVTKVNLRVRTDNQRAIALYLRKGFRIEGTLTKDLFVHGVYHDNILMGRDLEV